MKKCSRCSAENFEDQKFCNLCGRELTARIALDLYAGNPPSARAPEPEEVQTPETRAYQHFIRAKDQIAQRDLDGAIAEFKAALAACPGDPMIERLLKKTEEARDRATAPARPAGEAPRQAPRTLSRSLVEDPARPTAPAPRRPVASSPITMGDVSASAAIEDDVPPLPARRPAAGASPSRSVTPPPQPSHAARRGGPAPVPTSIPTAARPARPAGPQAMAQAASPRAFKGKHESDAPGARVAPHTGRFLELYERAPSLSPALALDGRSDEGIREIAVNLLILGGFLMFGFLLLL